MSDISHTIESAEISKSTLEDEFPDDANEVETEEFPDDSSEVDAEEFPDDSGVDDTNETSKEIHPKEGGSYSDAHRPGEGNTHETHHMPADDTTTLPFKDGPAIRMEKDDHRKTASCGSSAEAREYRAAQAELIKDGKFREAVQMDIEDIRDKFGDKYDDAIAEMEAYIDELEKEGKI